MSLRASFIPVLFALLPAVALAGATASSFRPETRKGANYFNAASALDGVPETAWVVPGDSANRGEWIMLDLPRCTVEKVGMIVGWLKDDATFKDYARVKTIKVEGFSVDDQQEVTPAGSSNFTFEDKKAFQIADIPDIQIGQDLFGGKLKIHIVDIFPGEDYPNVGISELLVYLKEFATTIRIVESGGAADNTTADNATDENPKTFWAVPLSSATFSIESGDCGVSSIGVQAGPKTLSRVKKVEVTANNRTETHVVPDDPKGGMVWFQVPSITGYTGGAFGQIDVKVLDVYPGADPSKVGFSEIGARATSCGGF
jgi:hypothetical protein